MCGCLATIFKELDTPAPRFAGWFRLTEAQVTLYDRLRTSRRCGVETGAPNVHNVLATFAPARQSRS